MASRSTIFILDDWDGGVTRRWGEMIHDARPCRLKQSGSGVWKIDQPLSGRNILLVHFSALVRKCDPSALVEWLKENPDLCAIVLSGAQIPEAERVSLAASDRIYAVRTAVDIPVDRQFGHRFAKFRDVFDREGFEAAVPHLEPSSNASAFEIGTEIMLCYLPDYLAGNEPGESPPIDHLWSRLKAALATRHGGKADTVIEAIRKLTNHPTSGQWYETLREELARLSDVLTGTSKDDARTQKLDSADTRESA
jgi:hypothetical protein